VATFKHAPRGKACMAIYNGEVAESLGRG
jgi:hypothetical protein